jgi:alanyl-tRNA synthetase
MKLSEQNPMFKTTDEIHEMYIDFYASRGYTHYPDSGIIPQNDPTLLLINSGMAPLKPFFTGDKIPPSNLLTNVQNCIRMGDIDDIGDSHHGTSFNMMGSWQFGPEFSKERATELAYELITDGFGLKPDLLSASVLSDEAEAQGIPADTESITAWERFLPKERIVALPADDNLWGPAGDSGPCGPCTEVFYDRGAEFAESDDTDQQLRRGQHIEIWNAGVFMEYFKDTAGSVTPLKSRSVDGGAGLERFAMVLQDAPSIHQIDRWLPIYEMAFADTQDVRGARIITDHVRTSEILLQSGITPANKAAAYVLRRLLRRSMSIMAQHDISQERLTDYQEAIQMRLPKILGAVTSRNETKEILELERQAFSKVLVRSTKLLKPLIDRGDVSGADVHTLHATHGIPVDLVREACVKSGVIFPESEYQTAQREHAARS